MAANFEAALAWRRKGYNVVPQKALDKKHPGVRWKDLQVRLVTVAELAQWESMFENGVGFITGAISGVIIVETDGPRGEALLADFEDRYGTLPPTLAIRSGSGRGLHRHFKHPGRRVKTVAHPAIQVDVKGDGGFCVLPPTLHKSGGRYEIVHDAIPAELPPRLLEFIEEEAKRAGGRMSKWPANSVSVLTGDRPRRRAIAKALGTNLLARTPINRTNVALVQSMLDALPDAYANEFDLWLRVGFALHQFDAGAAGLALWKRFSHRSPGKAERTDFVARWANLRGDDYDGKRISVGWLWAQARAKGWRAPCPWDRSTKIAS